MKRIALVVLAASAMPSAAYSADSADLATFNAAPTLAPQAIPYDWSGFYVGGSVGVVQSRSQGTIDYNSSNVTNPVGNWTDTNSFTGGVWHDVDGAVLAVTEANTSTDARLENVDLLAPWLTQIDLNDLDYAGTVQIGGQWQFDNFVVGGEVRGTFGEFGNSYSNSWSDEIFASDDGQFVDNGHAEDGTAKTAAIRPNGADAPNVTWTGTSDFGPDIFTTDAVVNLDFEGVVHQDSSLDFDVSYGSYFAPVARVGFAADRWMFFAMGGPAVAEVTATTAATVSETGVLSFSRDDAGGTLEPARFAEANYAWEGTNTETLWGYTIGGGVEFAATDNVILRFEGSMTNLGSISVTGTSLDTAAEYEVTQDVSNWSLATGVNFKF